MRVSLRRLAVFLLVSAPASAQVRLEPLTPRLSPAPAAVFFITSLPTALTTPSLIAAPAALSFAPSILAAPSAAPAPLVAPAAPAAAAFAAAAPAAADGPAPSARDALSSPGKAAAPADDSSFSQRSLNSFWDGLAGATREDGPVFALPSAGTSLLPQAAGAAERGQNLPSWLSLHDQKHAAALEAAVKLARGTHAGRRALDAAAKALDADGRVLRVDVLDLGRNYGEYDYLEDRLRLDKKMFLPGREAELAGTLAHELLHVAQHASGLLPSNALELEIEAHLLDLALMDELGITPPSHTFARQAQVALAKSPAAFIELIQAAVPGSPFLGESSFADIEDQLEQDLEDMSRKKSERAAKLAGAIENDIGLVRSKKGRAAYRAFSQRVLAELARRSAAARH